MLIPAALEGQINAETVKQMSAAACSIVAEGANGPTTPEADEVFKSAASSSSPTSCATPAA